MIICSEELKLALKCKALHHKELKDAIISHLAFASEYLREVKDPKTYFPTSKCFATHIWTNQKAQFKLKTPFHELIQNVKRVNRNRTIFTCEEICASLSKYIIDQRAQFFHENNFKICWVQNDPLGICFNVLAFHVTQLKALLWSQLTTCSVQTRKSPRLLNRNE